MTVKDLLSSFIDKDYFTIRILEQSESGLSVVHVDGHPFEHDYYDRIVSVWTIKNNRLDIIIKPSS